MEKKCVIIGMLGAGKTTLFNIITKQTEKAEDSLQSNTNQIVQSSSKEGLGFMVLDTPGFGSFDEEILTHTIGILAALTDGPINRILIVVKHEPRIDILLKDIDKILRFVKEYRTIISIIVTHKDQCVDPDYYYQQALNHITTKFNIQSVYFSSEQTSCAEICYFIDQQLVESGWFIKIEDSKFDQMMKGYIDNVLQAGKEQFLFKFDEFYHTVKKYVENFDENQEDSEQKLNSFICFVKDGAQKIQLNFEQSYGPFMDQQLIEYDSKPEKAYYYHTVLKHSIGEQVKEILSLAYKKMKYDKDHPFRQLRRCIFCGTMWLKISGCNGATICGNRPLKLDSDFFIFGQLYNTYEFQIIDNKLQCILIAQDEQDVLLNEIKQERITIIRYLLLRDQQFLFDIIDQLKLPEIFGQQFQYLQQLIFDQQNLENPQDIMRMRFSGFSLRAKSEIQKNIVELNHQIQLRTNNQIGCGRNIIWDLAPIVDIDEIDIKQDDLIQLLSDKDQRLKEEFNIYKQKLVNEAQQQKKIL